MSLTLQDVERLGGTKDDLELLGSVESGSEMEFGPEGEGEGKSSVPMAEIEAYIHSLGLDVRPASEVATTAESGKKKTKTKQNRKQDREEREEEKRERSRVSEKKGTGAVKKESVASQKSLEKRTSLKKKKIKSKSEVSGVAEDGEQGSESVMEVERQLLRISASLPHTRLLVSPDAEQLWFDQCVSQEAAYHVSSSTLTHLSSVAQQLMRTDTQLYDKMREKRKGASDVRWLNTVLTSGTLSDKVAARTLLVQESPVHALSSLDWLLALVAKGGGGGSSMKGLHAKRKGILATNTLKELWVSELLPEHRKLKSFHQRPLDQLLPTPASQASRRFLLLWYFEDQVKTRYLQFVSTLQAATHDPAQEVREKMLGHMFDLLYQRPEQEQLLLTQLVNKLGDPHRKVASKTVMFLLKLLNHHVNMKVIVAREIESLLHRSNVSAKAQYYGVCCLNQIVLSPEDGPLVAKLMDIYFTCFKVYIKQSSLESKMLGALLTGVNRAFPFMSEELPSFEEHLHSLFKVVHVGPISTGIQSLMLLYQVMESRQAVSSRYYNALYSKLLDPALKHCNRQAMFLNVLFKSLKSDPSMSRVKAFVKRMLHVCACHSTPFTCGCLVLLSELLKEKPALWPYIMQGNDEEVFRDVPGDQGDNETVGGEGGEGGGEGKMGQEGGGKGGGEGKMVDSRGTESYKIWHRNPQFSGAEDCCLWELKQLCEHYHPSVQLFAKKIASGEAVSYVSDPLDDFTLIKFLDRFVYKNPKLKESDHGGSAMQRTARSGIAPKRGLMANSAKFAALDESKVDVKELFMHKFLTQRRQVLKRRRKKAKDTDEGEEEKEEEEDSGDDGSLEAYSDMDFAGELQREATEQKQLAGRRKRKRENDESGEEREGTSEGEEEDEFDYDDMDKEDSEEEGEEEGEERASGDTMSEAELEKLLLQNMSDEDSGVEEEGETGNEKTRKGGNKSKRKKGTLKSNFDMNKMFAAADEFSHLLDSDDKGSHVKQLAWEDRRSERHDRGRRVERGGRGKGREGGRGRGRGRGGGMVDGERVGSRGEVGGYRGGRGRGQGRGGGERGGGTRGRGRGRGGGERGGGTRGRGRQGMGGVKRSRVEGGGGGWRRGGGGRGSGGRGRGVGRGRGRT